MRVLERRRIGFFLSGSSGKSVSCVEISWPGVMVLILLGHVPVLACWMDLGLSVHVWGWKRVAGEHLIHEAAVGVMVTWFGGLWHAQRCLFFAVAVSLGAGRSHDTINYR